MAARMQTLERQSSVHASPTGLHTKKGATHSGRRLERLAQRAQRTYFSSIKKRLYQIKNVSAV